MAWEVLAKTLTPGGDTLTLRRSGGDFEIRIGLLQLMSSRNSVSERALATIACARIGRPDARVLIGGLGMGCTVRAVLDGLGPEARLTVAELVPEVVAWNRGPLAGLAGRPLDDPRVTVAGGDVADVIRDNPRGFDAVLMDVDNGPGAVLFPANRALYSVEGVRLMLSALKTGGLLGIWAADPSLDFEGALGAGGFAWERTDVDVLGGLLHTLYLVRAG